MSHMLSHPTCTNLQVYPDFILKTILITLMLQVDTVSLNNMRRKLSLQLNIKYITS